MAVTSALMIGLAVASAAAGAASSVASANAQAAQARQEQATMNYNAEVAQKNNYSERVNHQQQDDYDIQENNQKLSQMRAVFGNSGLAFTGSSMDVLDSDSTQMGQTIANSDYNEDLKQQGEASEVEGMQMQANAYGQQAHQSIFNGIFGAGTAALGAASSFAGTDTGQSMFS